MAKDSDFKIWGFKVKGLCCSGVGLGLRNKGLRFRVS